MDNQQVCVKTAFDIFGKEAIQISVEDSQYVDFYPITPVDKSKVVEFYLESDNQYFDLSSARLIAKVKINQGPKVPKPGTTTGETQNAPIAGPVNNFLSSLFKECAVYLNGIQVQISICFTLHYKKKHRSLHQMTIILTEQC